MILNISVKSVNIFLIVDSLSPMPGATPYRPVDVGYNSKELESSDIKRARVLYDYDAKDATELSLMADEVNHKLYTSV